MRCQIETVMGQMARFPTIQCRLCHPTARMERSEVRGISRKLEGMRVLGAGKGSIEVVSYS